MILPIYTYGQPVLRKKTTDIDFANYQKLSELIANMYETMYNAEGVGLAAPQIGLTDRIFVVDLTPLADDKNPQFDGFKKVFINAHITERSGEVESVKEGCLSIPGVNEKVPRQGEIRIQYLDENGQAHDETYSGFMARVIQHEYDHLDGEMFVDHIPSFRKLMIKSKLSALKSGKVKCDYLVRVKR